MCIRRGRALYLYQREVALVRAAFGAKAPVTFFFFSMPQPRESFFIISRVSGKVCLALAAFPHTITLDFPVVEMMWPRLDNIGNKRATVQVCRSDLSLTWKIHRCGISMQPVEFKPEQFHKLLGAAEMNSIKRTSELDSCRRVSSFAL